MKASYRIVAVGFVVIILLLSGCATVNRQYQAWREYQTGLDLFRAEKYGEAHEHVKTALVLLPGRPEFLALQGWILFRQSQMNEARLLFSRVHEMDSKSVAGFQGLAWVEYTLGKYDTSEKWFVKQLEWAKDHMGNAEWVHYPENDVQYVHSIRSDAAYGLGLVALSRGKSREAGIFLAEAVAYPNSFTGHAPMFTAYGDLHFARKDYKSAINYYEKALASKENMWTAAKRGWCLYHLGDKAGADQVFMRLISSSSDRRPGLYGLVFTRHALGRTGEARGYLKELIHLDPYFPDTMDLYYLIIRTHDWRLLWKDFAEAYFERGNFARAAFKLEGYLPLARQDCEAQLMNGWCAHYLRGPQAGLAEFTGLSDRKLCPDDQVSTGKGVALLYLNRLDEAGKELEKASRENPGNTRSAVALGAVAFLKGRYEEAIRIYRDNMSRLPKQESYFSWPSHALNNLGWSYIKTGQYQEAFKAFQKLQTLHRNPVYPEIFDGLGWSLFYLKRFQESTEAFEHALRLAPGYRSSLSGLSSLQGLKK
jgi:tetratricopeptide (TPR) repeat protein